MQIKTIFVQGEIVTRNNVRVSTLQENLEKALNAELVKLGNAVIDVALSDIKGGTKSDAGSAVALIKYDPDKKSGK